MSAPSSRALAEWTSDSTEPDTERSSSQSPIPTGDESSPGIGPESRASRTFETWALQATLIGRHDEAGPQGLGVSQDSFYTLDKAGAPAVALTSSPADSHARTCQSPADAEGSQASAPASSSSSLGSQMSFSETVDGASSKMCPDFCLPTADEISPSFSQRFTTSGFSTSRGAFSTAASSAWPNAGGVSSSLPDVLQATAPERFSLSPRAAAGILRRAEKRGRALPPALHRALTALVSTDPDARRRTT